jgi:hypothetical protein
MEQAKIEIENHIKQRAVGLLRKLPLRQFPGSFYLAGNSLNPDKPRDLDLFPIGKSDFFEGIGKTIEEEYFDFKKIGKVVSTTQNAITLDVKGRIIQFCRYHKPDLEALINSFDFAHIQVGVKVELAKSEFQDRWSVFIKEVFFTDAYLAARVMGKTWFQGSEYPLSSLMRLLKYHKREHLSSYEAIREMISIVSAIIKRGFHNYPDFLDQMNAVDIALPPEYLEGVPLTELFDLLHRPQEEGTL